MKWRKETIYRRIQYRTRKIKGVCTVCGIKPLHTTTRCEYHAQVHNKKKRQLMKRNRKIWRSSGFCIRCTEKAVEGKARCQRHLDYDNKNYHDKKIT